MNDKIVVEVCHGLDCFGSGGGAAFLELEDLASSIRSCQRHNNNNNNNNTNSTTWSMTVVTGGCRNFCAMGPNVYYHDQHNVHQHHFTKVQSVQQCRVVLQHLHQQQQQQHLKNKGNIDIVGDDDDDDEEAVVGNGTIMMQRAEKKRWAFLRQVARAKKVAAASASTRQNTPGSQHDRLSGLIRDLEMELEHVIAAELSACSSQKDHNHKALERVGKRKIHYQDILKSLKPPPKEATSITGTG